MRRSRNSIMILVAGCLVLLTLALSPGRPAAQAQGNNLLLNPSFEGEYAGYTPNPGHALYGWQVNDCTPDWGGPAFCGTAQVPANWWPWWISQTDADPPWKNRMPEYKPAEAPFLNRVHGGSRAMQYFTFHGTHTAGVLQVVPVPANARLRFTIWGHAWSDAEDGGTSFFPTPVNMRIGIDTRGGTDPFSANIVWSGYTSVYDQYALFSVEAQAQGDRVTVFTFSAPNEARKHNDVYWDDASLVVIGQGAAPPPAPAPAGGGGGSAPPAAPAAAAPAGPTATPDADGVIYYVIEPGDSLWSAAAKSGITLADILELNDITRDTFVRVGDRLIVGHGEPEAAEEETPEADETTEAATPEPTIPASTPTPSAPQIRVQDDVSGGNICLKAFVDNNQNGIHDPGEPLAEAVAITISNSQTVVSNYVTTGAEAEPFCIEGLDSGNYRVTRSRAAGETLTTPGDWAVSVGNGQTLELEFGGFVDPAASAVEAVAARAADTALAAQVADDSGALVEAGELGGTGSGLVIAVIAVAVILLVAVLVVILSARRVNT